MAYKVVLQSIGISSKSLVKKMENEINGLEAVGWKLEKVLELSSAHKILLIFWKEDPPSYSMDDDLRPISS